MKRPNARQLTREHKRVTRNLEAALRAYAEHVLRVELENRMEVLEHELARRLSR